MATPGSIRRIVFQVGVLLLVVIGLIGAKLAYDATLMSQAQPPASLKTIDDLRAWKRGAIVGQGTFENAGATYTVLLAPAGRSLASGSAAYLFDEQGQFVDWTADMGDYYTVKNHFKLMGGLKNFKREKL